MPEVDEAWEHPTGLALHFGEPRNDLLAEYLQRLDLLHVRHVEDGVLAADACQDPALFGDVFGGHLSGRKLVRRE